MLKKIVVLLVLLTVFLAACSGSATELPAGESPQEQVETEAPAGEPSPSPENSPTGDAAGQATEMAEATCTVVSRSQEEDEESLVPAVGDDDWSQGSDDAAVTFIEYGDFQ